MSAPVKTEPFTHILCWVDGSDEACRAAERAAHLAQNMGADLTFVAVGKELGFDAGFADYAQIEGVSGPMPPVTQGDVDACLQQAIAISAKIGVPDAKRMVTSGDAAAAICSIARSSGTDLVVIRRYKSNLVERLLGASVADTLSDGCGFSVLSVG
ncbi:universal stress protein [uncultured Sulfitobacter sp.]|uniref:universal stress protein n=1 Tax=uncultured Sulfitobacter sp. TaxID=191468 RepID=UPI00262350CA|nr:universal stress protein [uncultured Sulfitobacter sp.]